MMRFLEVHPLALTPLTPIHVGCGEDFDPTNYVIDEGILFHFDPAAVHLTGDERRKLMDAVGTGGQEAIRRVQKFFFDRRETFSAFSSRAIPVAVGVAEQYKSRVGQTAQFETGGKRVSNILEIERTAHHPHTGTPFIPGSSLKGAMRTAWLSGLNGSRKPERGERADQLEARLLEGSFQTDPFRMIRLADAAGEDVLSRIVFSSNHKKRDVLDKQGRPRQAQGPTTRRETIAAGQYRSFRGELRIDNLGGLSVPEKTPAKGARIGGFAALAVACNRFYRTRLDEDLKVLEERGLASPAWINALRTLMEGARQALDAGMAMLVRVGRHSGAESVTIEGVRSIRIMKKRSEPPEFASSATTVWLAADREDSRSDMQPFGWLLVELTDAPAVPGLKEWCGAQSKPDLAAVREKLLAARRKAEEETARQRKLADDKKVGEEAALREAAERARRLSDMSEQGRLIEALREKLERHGGSKQPVSGVLYAEARKLIKAALEGSWSALDKRALAELVSGLGFQKIEFGGRAPEVKRDLRTLRGDV